VLRLKLLKKIGQPNYSSSLVTDWQNTNDIISALKAQHIDNRQYANKIAPYFCAENERETARNIFNFLKREIRYQVEPAEKQTVKSMPRLLADGYGDCKHYTNFANSILEACGYKPVYRFAGYSDKGLTHTYTYLPNSNTVLDAVLSSFDTEKTPKYKKDMSLYKMSGVDNASAEINGINFNKLAKNVKNAAAKASNTVKKAAAQIPAAAKKVVQKTATLGLAPARAAFTGLVALNVRGLATDLKKVFDKKGREGFQWWADLGGNRDDLLKVVNNNASKKRLLGVEEENAAFNEIYGGYSGDGVYIGEPVTLAASLAAASPILIKVADVIKKAGISSETITQAVTDAKNNFKQITGKDVSDIIFKKEANVNSNKLQYKSSDLQPTTDGDATKVATAALAYGTGTDINTIKEVVAEQASKEPTGVLTPKGGVLPMLPTLNNKTVLIGVAAVAAFLILRKK
jgi:hypothetical protein